MEDRGSRLELRIVKIVRSNYAPRVCNDRTGFEVMLGDMARKTIDGLMGWSYISGYGKSDRIKGLRKEVNHGPV